MRKLINDRWSFAKFKTGTEYETIADILENGYSGDPAESPVLSAISKVDVPHDWMISNTNDLYQSSVGVYTRTLLLDASKCNSLFFEGVYMRTTVYLNGEKIFFWPYGYTSFEVDLTPYQKEGENKLLIYVDYRNPNTRWYSGAGIFRDVWLLAKHPVHITEGGVYFHTEKTECSTQNVFSVTIDTEVTAELKPFEFKEKAIDKDIYNISAVTVLHELSDRDGSPVKASRNDINIYREPVTDTQSFTIDTPHLWDVDDPYLYTLKTTILCAGEILDSFTEKVGFRTIAFTPDKGFFLNGRSLKINGACQHHDLGALGSAFNKKAARRQLEKLQSIGVNAVRTSHNPPAPGLMELADEMGVLINSDAFDMWEMPKTENDYGIFFHEWCERDVEAWVRRDRNHPSVILWSCGNEIPDTNNPEAVKIAERLQAAIRRNDSRHNAYTTIASNFVAWETAQKSQNVFELSGYNYLESVYDEHHEKFPHWCIYGSETASTVQSRGIYHFPKSNRLLTYEDRQCSVLDNCSTNWGAKSVQKFITDHRDRDYCAGQFIWTGWDYIGEPTPYFSKNSFFGHIDTAGFLKDTAYIIKSAWVSCSRDPFVHISPYWDFNPGQLIDIEVYSNAPHIVLYINDEKIGEKALDQLHDTDFAGHFSLPYKAGRLRAEAYDASGKLIAVDETESFGNPAAVRLTAEYETIKADGEDLQFIQISALDADGNEVYNARNRMQVSVSGPGRLIGLDNGDSTDYDQYKCNSRKLFSGKLLAIIASTNEPGTITVNVSSAGLKSASLSFDSLPSEIREGISYDYNIEKTDTAALASCPDEIPVRKLTMTASSVKLTPDVPKAEVNLQIEPFNATYSDISVKAMTLNGIESNAVKISYDNLKAVVTAVSDGEFRLVAYANNGKEHPEILSELEFSVSEFGNTALDPYSFIYGCQFAASTVESLLSFRGSINFGNNNTVRFDNVDFGEFGSDKLVISLFSFRNEEPVEIWDGEPDEGTLLCSGIYSVPTEYNVLQEYTFTLSKRLSGVRSIHFRFKNGFVFGGFRMIYAEKAYSQINAAEHNMITGDSYDEREDGVYSIGNNVDIEFTNMNFSRGVSSVTIKGRARNKENPIHIRFFRNDDVIKRMVEFPPSDELQEITFPINGFSGEGKVNFIFLPGSDFDFTDFKFNE